MFLNFYFLQNCTKSISVAKINFIDNVYNIVDKLFKFIANLNEDNTKVLQ